MVLYYNIYTNFIFIRKMAAQQSSEITAGKAERSQGIVYPSTSTLFAQHIEESGSFSQACKNLLEWIKKEDLTREQIISIQASETASQDANAVLTVFYRRNKDPLQQTSLRDLQYHLINNLNAWMVQYLEVQELIARGPIDIISLTHTARNIGQVNIQILWFLPGND